jgi:hypothetical protein
VARAPCLGIWRMAVARIGGLHALAAWVGACCRGCCGCGRCISLLNGIWVDTLRHPLRASPLPWLAAKWRLTWLVSLRLFAATCYVHCTLFAWYWFRLSCQLVGLWLSGGAQTCVWMANCASFRHCTTGRASHSQDKVQRGRGAEQAPQKSGVSAACALPPAELHSASRSVEQLARPGWTAACCAIVVQLAARAGAVVQWQHSGWLVLMNDPGSVAALCTALPCSLQQLPGVQDYCSILGVRLDPVVLLVLIEATLMEGGHEELVTSLCDQLQVLH